MPSNAAKSAKKSKFKCACCDKWVEDEQPWRGSGTDAICYDCWRDNHTFDCCKCGEIEDDEYQDEIGCLLVVTEDCGVPPGLYKIIAHPYYGGPTIGSSYVFPESLRRVGDVPAGCGTDPFPCGHLCRNCAAKRRRKKEVSNAK